LIYLQKIIEKGFELNNLFGGVKMKDNETRQKFIELRAKGVSFSKIAKELKIAKSTLITWSKEHLMEIDNLKAVELESLQEQFFMTKIARIELLGRQVERMKKELENRDFSDVPSDKLLDALNKTLIQLKNDETEITFKGECDTLEDLVSSINTVTWKP
jgi:intein-encoded DNA endonuclease-like protein